MPRHALVSAGTKAAFGALGGWAATAIAERLRDHGILAPGGAALGVDRPGCGGALHPPS